jgi:single-strand DNA-binding protein
MNKVELVGRLTRDPELKYSTGENANAVARFSIAVNRRFKNAAGEYEADFPSCVAFGKTAEFVDKWFNKGDLIGVAGRIQTGSYTNKDGIKVYTTDVVADEVEFVGGKNQNADDGSTAKIQSAKKPKDTDWMNAPVGDEDVPW